MNKRQNRHRYIVEKIENTSTEDLRAQASSPVLAAARTTPTAVPLRTSSGTVKKYWACSNTGDATEPPTTLTFTLALRGAVRPPPSSADITMEITVLAFPWSEREREITPEEEERWGEKINYSISFWVKHSKAPSFHKSLSIVGVGVSTHTHTHTHTHTIVALAAHTHTCVLVKSEESRAPSRYRAVGHPAVFPSIRVIRCYLDDGGSRGTMGTETDCVKDWIEGRPVVIDVHHQDPHTSHWFPTTLKKQFVRLDMIVDLWIKI